MASTELAPPSVMWAQRNSLIFLTVCLEDCKDPKIELKPDQLYFKGTGGPDKKGHEVTIRFFKEINTDDSKYAVRDRVIEFALQKKEPGPYWDRLLKDKAKVHWLRVDFSKWKDEDDSDEEAGGNQDLEEMMRQMGGLGGMGGGMDPSSMGMGMDRPSLDDLKDEDSDDEELPDLE